MFPNRLGKALLVTVVSLLVLSPVAYGARAPSASLAFSTIQNLSNNSGASTAPVVATVFWGGHQYVYVAWEDASPGKKTTFFRVSADGGSTFGTITQFTGLPGAANPNTSAVQIAAKDNYVYLTWKQGTATAYAASSDNGAHFTWGLLSNGSVPGQNSIASPAGIMTAQALATNGTAAYFTWFDAITNGSQFIEFVATYNGGSTFTSPVQINTGPACQTNPDGLCIAREDELTAIGDYVYAVWDLIWFSASGNGGVPGTWSTPTYLVPPSCSLTDLCVGREPMISASGTNVYVTFPMGGYQGVSPYSTMIAVSNDHGQTWLNATGTSSCVPSFADPTCVPAKVLSGGLSNTREVQVASNGSSVYVTSRGTASGIRGTQQYVYVSNDNGSTFKTPKVLSSSPLSGPESGFGGFALDQTTGNVYVQWPHGKISQLYISESIDSGATWSGAQQVSSSSRGVVAMGDPNGGQGPMAAADHGNVYIVWEDTSTGNGDIYFTSAPSL